MLAEDETCQINERTELFPESLYASNPLGSLYAVKTKWRDVCRSLMHALLKKL
jgi:hypothetical protein